MNSGDKNDMNEARNNRRTGSKGIVAGSHGWLVAVILAVNVIMLDLLN